MKSGGLRRAPTCSSGAIWSVGFGFALLTNYHYQSAISNVRIILHTTIGDDAFRASPCEESVRKLKESRGIGAQQPKEN